MVVGGDPHVRIVCRIMGRNFTKGIIEPFGDLRVSFDTSLSLNLLIPITKVCFYLL